MPRKLKIHARDPKPLGSTRTFILSDCGYVAEVKNTRKRGAKTINCIRCHRTKAARK